MYRASTCLRISLARMVITKLINLGQIPSDCKTYGGILILRGRGKGRGRGEGKGEGRGREGEGKGEGRGGGGGGGGGGGRGREGEGKEGGRRHSKSLQFS